MARGLVAKKMGMSSFFDTDGACVSVTVLQADKNRVLQVKSKDKDGYDAVQLGFWPVRKSLLSKAEQGRQKGLDRPYRVLREFRNFGDCKLGEEFGVEIFEIGANVLVRGTSKGKGFQGVMKRHGFSGGRATHGSGFHRAPGSLNASAYPSRVFKGKKLPGHTGAKRSTIRNLKVAALDKEQGLIFIRGSVPGPRKSCVTIEVMEK